MTLTRGSFRLWNGICICHAHFVRRAAHAGMRTGRADFMDVKLMDRHAYPSASPGASLDDGRPHRQVAERRVAQGGLALRLPVSVVVPTCGRADLLNRCM